MRYQLLLFGLDGTLLTGDKRISPRTLSALRRCRAQGLMIGVSTSRSEQNSLAYLARLSPEVLISSGGSLVKWDHQVIFCRTFTPRETEEIIRAAREVCGGDCQITVDTLDRHYWNAEEDVRQTDRNWGESVYCDFKTVQLESLKVCVEIASQANADRLRQRLAKCDCVRFSDGYWYKFTPRGVTKETAIQKLCAACGIRPEEIIAFGDDLADMGMLGLCGLGVAMGNAVELVKQAADIVIGSNDEDGIAVFLEEQFHLS